MAWLETPPSGNIHIGFRIGDEKFRRSLRTKNQREANSRHARIEENIRLVEAGRLVIPEDADVITFLLSDGKLSQEIKIPKRTQIGKLYHKYVECLPEDSMEENSLYTASIHMQHLVKNLPANLDLRNLSAEHLQTYINTRSQQVGRYGKKVSATTIRKEIATLRSIWNWAIAQEYVTSPLPTHGLKYPKLDEKPPFRTREEIEREIEVGELPEPEQKELWQCLYLRSHEIFEILSLINQNQQYSYLFPMAAFAAYTGARRSELCRSQLKDIQLIQGSVLIREKKRNRSKRTFRQVPIGSTLQPILQTWLETPGGGQAAFQRTWPQTRKHVQPEVEGGIIPAEAQKHLKSALRNTKWRIISGWHVFRHSFISNCASQGVDQRMIDDWVGHQTDEQRKRYRHLFPDIQKREIDRVF